MPDRVTVSNRPHGTMIIMPEFGGVIEADTLRCCHCGRHFLVVRGSGTRRGFCMKCSAPTCGSQECCTCTPFEQQLERIEKGLSPVPD